MAKEKFQGKRLLLIRTYLGLTLKDMSNLTDISEQTLSKYEQDGVQPTLGSLLAICKIFNLDTKVFHGNDVTFSVMDNNLRFLDGSESGILGWYSAHISREKLLEMMFNRKKDLK